MPARARRIDVEPVLAPTPEAAARLRRLRRIAWWMDRSIPLGGKWRIGLDPLLGLVPGIGDWIGAGVSLWVVYEGVRLGLPGSVLLRMGANVVVEATLGAVPGLGDLFDAAWQANQRNVRLIEAHYDPRLRPRSLRGIALAFGLCAVLFLCFVAVLIYLVARGIVWLLSA